MDFRETEWEGVCWIHLIPDREQWRAFVPSRSIKCGKFRDLLSDC
jgi:hypothetical protein